MGRLSVTISTTIASSITSIAITSVCSPTVFAQARWQILHPRPPAAFVAAKGQLECTAVEEEAVLQPILRVRLAVQRRLLDIDVLVARVEVDVTYRCGLAGLLVLDGHRWEERRSDEVDILAGVGEDAQHGSV